MITVSALTSTKPATKTAYHHGDLRSALVEAGLAILAEAGDAGALSLREAARRAGVSAMAPYRHFADKEALLAAIASVGFERLAAAQRDAEADAGSPVAALKAQGQAYVAFACANPALFRLMFGAGAPLLQGPLAEAGKASFDLLASRVASLPSKAATADRVLAHWSLMHGLAMLAVDGKLGLFEGSPQALAERVTELGACAKQRATWPKRNNDPD